MHLENVSNANICTKHAKLTLLKFKVLFYGAYVGGEPVFSTGVSIPVQTNVARGDFRALLSYQS